MAGICKVKRFHTSIVWNSLIALSLVLGFSTECMAQQARFLSEVSSSMEKAHKDAIGKLRQMEFAQAEKGFLKILRKEPGLVESRRELGLLYFRQKRYDEAVEHLAFAANHDPEWSNSLQWTLASTYWELDDWSASEQALKDLFKNPIQGSRLQIEAEKMMRDAKFWQTISSKPPTTVSLLPSPEVNTEWPEYLPVISTDGQTLIFTRRMKNKEDFFLSKKTAEGSWHMAKPIQELNSTQNEGALCISADGKSIIYAICNDPSGFGSCDLYISEKLGTRWSQPRNMGPAINTPHKETQPSLAPDGSRLYFVSNRPGGQGGEDIWYSDRQANGSWGTPVNLGEHINTPWDEVTPLIHFDGETLFFSSSGHPGMGGLDMFVSKRMPEDSWSTPVNLGPGINTKLDESCLAVELNGHKAYMAKEYKESRILQTMNLVSFELPEHARAKSSAYILFAVKDAESNAHLRAVLEIVRLSDGKRQAIVKADREGEALLCMPLGEKYAFVAFLPGYIPQSAHFDFTYGVGVDTMVQELALFPIPSIEERDLVEAREKETTLENVFFDSGASTLLQESQYELTQLAQWMQAHPNVRIMVSGHTDNIGRAELNQKLSEDRARSVVQFLQSKGVEASRLEYEGLGSQRPIADNETAEGRAKNRRTTFRVIGNP